jgi:hypothetical protein
LSQRAFQTALARMVIEPEFRDRVASGGPFGGYELTELERRRLVDCANDRGMDVTRMLYKGWRLTKLVAMAPLTCALLGDRLIDEASSFWLFNPPTSLYFLDEALGFLAHVEARRPDGVSAEKLNAIVTFERGLLESRRAALLTMEHASGIPV